MQITSLLIGLYVGVSVGAMQLYYLMTADFWGALLLLIIWPYVIYLRVREDFWPSQKGE